MSFLKVSVVLSLIACLITTVTSAAVQETNAQRMARGLPPSPPKFVRDLRPTRAWAAERGVASPKPPIQVSGRLQVRNPENGQPIGNVRNTNGTSPISGLNFVLVPEQDLIVSFTAPPSGQGPFDILVTNAAFPAPLFVGASFGPNNSGSIGPKARDTVAFSNVQQTPPNSTPVKSTYGDNSMVESAIWSFNPDTKELKAQYVNPDNSKPATVIAYDIRANVLFFVGDIDAYNKDNNTPASAVEVFLVPI